MTQSTVTPDLAALGGGEPGPPVVKAVIPAAGLGTRFLPATKATPKEIVSKLSAELARIIASPEGVAGLQSVKLVPVGGTAESFEATLQRDFARWATVVKTAGVKGD